MARLLSTAQPIEKEPGRPTAHPLRAVGLLAPQRIGTSLWRHRWPLLFIAPFFVLFAIFFLYPIGYSAWLSFHDWSLIGPARSVGFANYRELLHDSLFWQSMTNAALLFFIYVPAMTFLALVLAALLNSSYVRLQGIFRTLIFLPYVMSGTVAASFTFQLLLDRNAGYANRFLSFLSISPVPWLDDIWWARVSMGLLVLWAWLGYNMLIMLAGLQAIPPELSEAAKVDGAGPVQILFRITIPLLRPVIVFSLTLSIIGTFSLFTEPKILFNPAGGPAHSAQTPVLEIWQTTFAYLRIGYSAAMSYVYFAIIMVIALTQYFLVSRRDPYYERRR
jgi:lactose/L-arabinose transport system permease protein